MGYSEKAISQALEHKINQVNEMNCISDNDVDFISSIYIFTMKVLITVIQNSKITAKIATILF